VTARRGTVVETQSGIAVSPAQPARRPGVVARWVAITAVEIVIAIHVLLTPMHLRETLYVGVLFIVGNALLLLALLLMTGTRRELAGWSLAAAVCAGEFVGFVLSRTTGLPLGYHETWASAPEDYLGLVSLACDVAFGAAAVAWVRASGASPRGGRTGTA
jgi:hypothetical protein